MTAVSAGPGKSASQIYFYDWSENYRKVPLSTWSLVYIMVGVQEGYQGTEGCRGSKT